MHRNWSGRELRREKEYARQRKQHKQSPEAGNSVEQDPRSHASFAEVPGEGRQQ